MSRRTVFHGGTIRTMDPARPRAGALVVEAGRIAAVLPPGETPPREPGEERIDLAGRALVPGFIDGHTHLMHWGFRFLRPDLAAAGSPGDVLDRIREAHASTPPGRPVIGEGWDESGWTERRFPERRELDRISADRPILLRRICGHTAVANSAALVRFPDSPEVDRETGLLLEESAMGIARWFPPSPEELDDALAAAERSYLSLGVTGVHDMSLPAHLSAFERAAAAGRMRLSVSAILTRGHLVPLAEAGLGAGWSRGPVRVWGVKFFSDGSLGARTAALHADYADRPGERGLLLLDRAELESSIRIAEAAGLPLAIHAIGDRAVDFVLDAFAAVLPPTGSPLGHRIEHLEMVGPDSLARMRTLGIVASMQPNFVGNWGGAGGLYEQRLGPSRTAAMNPMRRVLAAGVGLVFGSDGMPADPLYGVRSAVAAPHSDQRLSPDEALFAATRAAALSAGWEDRGWLVAGARADLALLSADPGGDPAPASVRVAATVIAGERVFESVE